ENRGLPTRNLHEQEIGNAVATERHFEQTLTSGRLCHRHIANFGTSTNGVHCKNIPLITTEYINRCESSQHCIRSQRACLCPCLCPYSLRQCLSAKFIYCSQS